MRRVALVLLAVVAVLLLPASAFAAPVLVLGRNGHVTRHDDPYVSAAVTPAPSAPLAAPASLAAAPLSSGGGSLGGPPTNGTGTTGTGTTGTGTTGTGTTGTGTTATGTTGTGTTATGRGTTHSGKHHKQPPVTVSSVLTKLQAAGKITSAQKSTALGDFNAAVASEKKLSGTRHTELSAVTTDVHDMAIAGQLWPSRLAAVEATLVANRRWWTTGDAGLAYGARVQFQGSQLLWEYYPGQGIQLQVLGSFGAANGMYQAGALQYPELKQLLSELIPLASNRAGGLTWEYYFDWEGGSPPWTSAMSQATALQALTHAYEATQDPYYLSIAKRALTVFEKTPAQGGVAIPTPRGLRFIQYSFSPETSIINAFLQSLLGLYTYAQVSHSAVAARLFAEGNAEAEWEVPHFNTGAWSLYEPGEEDDLSYHELVTGFLKQLCTLIKANVYCTTYQDFTADETTPPVLSVLTHRARAKRPFTLRFSLSKISQVGVTIRRGATVVFQTSASFGYGSRTVSVPKLPAGSYTVSLTATDLAGNYARLTPATLTISS